MRRLLWALLLAVPPSAAAANPMPLPLTAPVTACRVAAAVAERKAGIPAGLLAAIARVESGRPNPQTGAVTPWPWTVNAEGVGHFYASKAEAIAAVRAMQARGVQSIDVGCMQVNLMYHPDAFASLEDAFDPMTNAAYAARFLSELRVETGSWPQAAAAYHSQTPEVGADYQRKVMAAWPEETRNPGNMGGPLMWAMRRFPPGTGAVMLSNGAAHARVIRLQAGPDGAIPAGRDLAAYRRAPIALTVRAMGPPGS